MNDIKRYANSHFLNILLCIKNFKKNDNDDKEEIRKIILLYMEIRKELLQARKTLT